MLTDIALQGYQALREFRFSDPFVYVDSKGTIFEKDFDGTILDLPLMYVSTVEIPSSVLDEA